MADINVVSRSFSTAVGRWASFGPYYAMFPVEFAFSVVSEHSRKNDFVLDPFAGRATSVYAAASQGRCALGIEITAVGWLFGQVKFAAATGAEVLARLSAMRDVTQDFASQADALPEFYRYCFASEVRRFLVAARTLLAWRTDPVDMTLMAFTVMYLHGKLGEGLSNQMRGTKAMSPEYSVQWWKANNFATPPAVDWYAHLKKRIEWRYRYDRPQTQGGGVWLGDSTVRMKELKAQVAAGQRPRVALLFTSPPYHSVINYYKDQWLRNWMLGGTDLPSSSTEKYAKRFESQTDYRALLETVFSDCAAVMNEDGVVYVRTDARQFTLQVTKEALAKAFPRHEMQVTPAPVNGHTQTALFGDRTAKPGEMDILMRPTKPAAGQ